MGQGNFDLNLSRITSSYLVLPRLAQSTERRRGLIDKKNSPMSYLSIRTFFATQRTNTEKRAHATIFNERLNKPNADGHGCTGILYWTLHTAQHKRFCSRNTKNSFRHWSSAFHFKTSKPSYREPVCKLKCYTLFTLRNTRKKVIEVERIATSSTFLPFLSS